MNGHLSMAQWLYSFGGISNEDLLYVCENAFDADITISSW
jgi:hypothetical protein